MFICFSLNLTYIFSPNSSTEASTSTSTVPEASTSCIQDKEAALSETSSRDTQEESKPTTSTSTPKRLDDARACKICFSEEIGVAFLPCGHLVSCVNCVSSLTTCAVCRKPFSATVRVFLS